MRNRLSTGALARRSARRPWLTIGAWLGALVVAGFLIVSFLGDALTTEADVTNTPESRAAELLVEERMPGSADEPDEVVVVRSGERSVDDPAFRAHVDALARAGGKRSARSRPRPTTPTATSRSSRPIATRPCVPLRLSDDSDSTVERLVDEVAAANGDDGFETAITGPLTADVDFNTAAEEDLQRGEMLGIGIALIVLLVVFGALVASLVPILLALVSIVVGLGLTALVGAGFELSFFVVNMLVMMGLAVGIDYALFVVSRFREEREKGLEKLEAIAAAGSTASRAVFFSGVTVVLALVGMFLIPSTIFRSLAVGAILVVLVTVIAALTLLPAVLSLLGDRINALRIPFVRPAERGRLLGPCRARRDAPAGREPRRKRCPARGGRRPLRRHQRRLRRRLDPPRQLRVEARLRAPRRGVRLRDGARGDRHRRRHRLTPGTGGHRPAGRAPRLRRELRHGPSSRSTTRATWRS